MNLPTRVYAIGSMMTILGLMFACQAADRSPSYLHVDPLSPEGRLSEAAFSRTRVNVRYDGAYRALAYPGGDVANDRGVCSDVVIRAYRALGVDLQQLVHEDMSQAFDEYPDRWGLKRPDTNIDHRRVPNLEQFFTRSGAALSTRKDADYQPGDVVSWRLPHGAPHIGIVHSTLSRDGKRPLVVHNIGLGPVLDDSLFRYEINVHFRYHKTSPTRVAPGVSQSSD